MTIEQLIPQIVKTLREISEWPWKDHPTDEYWIVSSTNHGVVTVEDVEKHFIKNSPLWLAQMVVGIVEERAELNYRRQGGKWGFIALTDKEQREWQTRALRDFSTSTEDYEWLKGKVGK